MGGQSRRRSAGIATVVSGVLRALSIGTPAALLDAPATLAQSFEPTALAADIPAQPLAQALEAFARQTGLQLVYVSGVMRDQRSHAVSAGLDANEALARMLEGTGLKFEYLTARSIRILAAVVAPPRETTTKIPSGDELQEVIVTANRREENLQNVPMTIQVLTGETLAKLNATTFDDFVKYLPAVTALEWGPDRTTSMCAASRRLQRAYSRRVSSVLSRTWRFTSMSNPRSFQAAILTSTPRISSESRSWRVPRAPCSGRAPRRVSCVTSRTSRSSM